MNSQNSSSDSGVLKYPNNEKEAANLVRVDRWVGLSQFAIQDDIQYLMLHFKSKTTHTLKDFQDVWNELHFYLIHYSCVKRQYRREFMSAFYAYTLDYLASPSDLYTSAVLFTLYFLYFSQPAVWDKISIRVNINTWTRLFDFYAESIEKEQNMEAAFVFDKLRKQEAFVFVAEEKVDSSSMQEREEFKEARSLLDKLHEAHLESIKNDTIEDCYNTKAYESLVEKYMNAKRYALSTPQLTVVTQQMIKDRLHVIESNPRRLVNYIKGTGITEDDTLLLNLSRQQRLKAKINKIKLRNEQKKKKQKLESQQQQQQQQLPQ